ncbi:MAG TPA: integrase [Desulfobulbaceae bacterium]|nr:MAG: hypothetical protein A2520_06185 [Deltaproteobacteria bacterium RIFOXYD12_FULL_53_23]HCC53488.1 integrase [Desulfobulbaceae bacterium]
MARWIKSKHPGIRYREHDTRRHGVGNKPDRYYTIFYKLDGKMAEEAVGWASQGMTEKRASAILAELQENRRQGTGPRTLKEKRGIAAAERQEQEEQDKQTAIETLTFSDIFHTKYLLHTQANRRNPRSWKSEESLFRIWIGPVIGNKPLGDIAPIDLEKIKKAMATAGRAGSSIVYALAVVRQVFNYALTNDLYTGKNQAGPAGKVNRPKFDNKRTRYLSREEATTLLAQLAVMSQNVHDMALLSIHTGMRADEVFSLTWADVCISTGIITLRDTKNPKGRPAFMTEAVKAMLQARTKSAPAGLVFPDRNGAKIKQASDTFNRAVDKIGLNEGITEKRQRVTFHTLRHTFASWLVESGTDIYYVMKLLGHSDIKLTMRYAHLGENSLKTAVQRMEAAG